LETFISTKWNIPKYSLFFFTIFFDLEKMIFEIFNISENKIFNVELAKVLRWFVLFCHIEISQTMAQVMLHSWYL